MKRILLPTLIALTVSGASLAQQATEEVDSTIEGMSDSVESTIESTANEAEEMVDQSTAEAGTMTRQLMGEERELLRDPRNITREGYIPIEPIDMTAENLTGTRVYGANDEDIGEIDELLLSEDGSNVEQVVVDIGGFLGLGEHEVAVTMEELHIMRTEDGGDFRAYMDATQEELEAQPEYDG